ncbi:Kelch-like protein 28 [Acipenser ruthenus]|uniref:Kelch-like protein 28 n=1 Tax=Acipenser ruthenus TaxID=7906 RepID=A0A662YPT2_ACIRT|nr:Kelch-like protein 28 [Acipenser ruthenus]
MEQPAQSYMLASLTRPHSEQLLQGLQLLRQHRELCDIVLRVGDAKIHAHKVVLASISPYFKAMFTGNLSEKENSEVEFQCIDEAALQAIVEYAYTGTVFISQETVESLLPAANLLQVKLVLKECCAFLESQLDASNCIGISRFADTYGCNDLYLAATKFICQHFEEVCRTEEFFELTRAELDEILSNDCLNVVTEETVFYALESWLKYDVQERQQYLAQLLHCVRLPLLSVKFLTRLYEANHLIRDDHTCKHLLNEALKYHFMPEHRLSYQTVLSTRPRCAPKVLMEMYFPQTDSWIGLAPLSVPRYEFGIAVLDQKVFVLGGIATHMRQGISYRRHESTVESWDPETNTWTLAERMTESRSTLGVVVLAGELYAMGGYDGQYYLQSVEKYIPKVKEWHPVALMMKSRSCFSAAVLDGMIYAIGGYGPAHMNSDVTQFGSLSHHWTICYIFHITKPTHTHLSFPVAGVGAAIIDNYLYVVGGHSGSSYLNTVQRYDPITDNWLDSSGMMYCRCNYGLTAL